MFGLIAESLLQRAWQAIERERAREREREREREEEGEGERTLDSISASRLKVNNPDPSTDCTQGGPHTVTNPSLHPTSPSPLYIQQEISGTPQFHLSYHLSPSLSVSLTLFALSLSLSLSHTLFLYLSL